MITTRPIDQIKPDPNQPRKVFSDEYLAGLAESLKIEGMINPIEIDSDNRILTGECRWRAAKLAGWTEVPVNLNEKKLPEYERLRHQMAENLHQSGEGSPMNPIDVAKGFKNLLEMRGHPVNLLAARNSGSDKGITELSEELGVSADKISEYLNRLWEPEYVLESIRKEPEKFSSFVEASNVPEKYREDIKRAITEGKIEGKMAVRRFAQVAKTRPDKAELEFYRITEKQNADANAVLNRALDLLIVLKKTDPTGFSDMDKKAVYSQLGSVNGTIRNYIGKMNKGGESQ